MKVFYNDIEPYAVRWLQHLSLLGEISPGDVSGASITELEAWQIAHYDRVHLCAGIGGWDYALKLAGFPLSQPVWTASFPCQPFSAAGKQEGEKDVRHIWPVGRDLIEQCKPPIIFGEQVASKLGREWLSGVRSDLEALGYAVGAADLCAASVRAPHARQRLYWFAYSTVHGQERLQRCSAAQIPQDGTLKTLDAWHGFGSPFENWRQLLAEPHVIRVDDGVSSSVDIRPRLHAYGNAIVPQLAAVFIVSAMEVLNVR